MALDRLVTGSPRRVSSGSQRVLRNRSFLFLQSMPSRFFERLGAALAARGHAVHRVNFNGGDRAFWKLANSIEFHGRECEWPAFLGRLLADRAISDIILFADCRPQHRM